MVRLPRVMQCIFFFHWPIHIFKYGASGVVYDWQCTCVFECNMKGGQCSWWINSLVYTWRLIAWLCECMRFHLTRLETRTKESTECVSLTIVCKNTLLSAICVPKTTQSNVTGVSVNVFIRTRKMVNYAWEKWNQGKLWWRFAVLLTCKSFVKLGYRGERLIEPSSSWFPLKFPSG